MVHTTEPLKSCVSLSNSFSLSGALNYDSILSYRIINLFEFYESWKSKYGLPFLQNQESLCGYKGCLPACPVVAFVNTLPSMTLQTGSPQGVLADIWSLEFNFLRTLRVSPGLAGACAGVYLAFGFLQRPESSWTDVWLSLGVPHLWRDETSRAGNPNHSLCSTGFSISRDQSHVSASILFFSSKLVMVRLRGSSLSEVLATQVWGPRAH